MTSGLNPKLETLNPNPKPQVIEAIDKTLAAHKPGAEFVEPAGAQGQGLGFRV